MPAILEDAAMPGMPEDVGSEDEEEEEWRRMQQAHVQALQLHAETQRKLHEDIQACALLLRDHPEFERTHGELKRKTQEMHETNAREMDAHVEYVRECEAELDRGRQALREAELKQSRLEDAFNRKKRRLQAALAREEMSGM